MTTETTGGGESGYLHRLLADSARPFRFRGRIRALLGLPDSSGVHVNFSKPLPPGAFAYLVPRFSGEFEFPDELLAESPGRGGERVAEIVPSARRRPVESVDPGQTNAEARVPPATRPIVPQSAQASDSVAKQPNDAVAKPPGASALRPAGEAAQHASGSSEDRSFPAYEVVVPGGDRLPDSMPGSQTGTPQAIVPTPRAFDLMSARSITATPASTTKHSPVPMAGEAPYPQRPQRTSSPRAPIPPEGHAGLVPPLPGAPGSSIRQDAPCEAQARCAPARQPLVNQSPARQEPPSADPMPLDAGRAPGPTRGASSPSPASIPSPRVRTRPAPTPLEPPTPTRSPSSRRQPDAPLAGRVRVPAQASFDNYRQSQPDAPVSQTPAMPPAPLPVVVGQPFPGTAMTPSAFWERRHLSHLKVRVRR